MKSFTIVLAVGASVLLGATAANANPANTVTERSTDFSSQHYQRQGHGAQRVVRTQHGQPQRSHRRAVYGGGHGGGHGGTGITVGVGGGGHGGGLR